MGRWCRHLFFFWGICTGLWAQPTEPITTTRLKRDKKDADLLNIMSRDLQTKSPEKALLYAQQAYLLSERLNYLKGSNEALFYIANAYYQQVNYSKSLEYYQRALELYRQAQNKAGEAISLRRIGNIYFEFGDYPPALEHYTNSLKAYEALNDQNGIAACYGNIANIYAAGKDQDQAIEYYQKSLLISRKIKNNRITGLNLSNIAEVYADKGDYRQALDFYAQSEATLHTLSDSALIAIPLTGRGDVFLKMGNPNQALALYLYVLETAQRQRDIERLAHIYHSIGKVYLRTRGFARAADYLQKSLKLAQDLRLKKLIRDNYEELAKAYEQLGDKTSSLDSYKMFKAYHDSLYNQNRLVMLAEMQARFQADVKERENRLQRQQIDNLNEQRRQQRAEIETKERNLWLQTLVIFAFAGLFILAGVFAYTSYKNRQTIAIAYAELSQRNEEILAQKEEIERQKQEIEKQSEQLVQTYLKITDSIRYAETIQQSILPSNTRMQEILQEYFVIAKAKEVVSGDFYWLTKALDYTFVAVVDCTGHGVSGGFMTMIGHTLLNEIVNVQKIYNPAEILENLNAGLVNIIEKRNQEIAIGMEVGLCRIEPHPSQDDKVKVIYAGAKRPLFAIHPSTDAPNQDHLLELRGDREPIGFGITGQRTYRNQELELLKGSILYLASDGFVDQANPQNKRLGSPRLKQLLLEAAIQPLPQQKKMLEHFLQNYQQNASQRDDITLVGVRV